MNQKQLLSIDRIDRFCEYVERGIGIRLSAKDAAIEKKIVAIAKELGFENTAMGLDHLLQSPLTHDNINVLARHLTIGETYFFRDPNIYSALENHILPQLITEHQQDKTIRLWCAGCSSGEEPYSIAILLYQLIPSIKNWNIIIIGTDINPEAIKKAEKAEYKMWSFRAMPSETLKKYFIQIKEGLYELRPEIRRMVSLQNHNLTQCPPLPQIDLILCLNVLIYFSPEQIAHSVDSLVNALTEKGWLCVSAVEVPFIKHPSLKIMPFPNTTFFLKDSYQIEQGITQSTYSPPVPKKEVSFKAQMTKSLKVTKTEFIPKAPKVNSSYENWLSLYKEGKYNCIISDLEALLFPLKSKPQKVLPHLKSLLLLISAYANQRKLEHAAEWCAYALQVDKTNSYLYYLYATILHEMEQDKEALCAIDKALFLDPDFTAAYFLGGTLHLKQNSVDTAHRYLRNAQELLSRLRPDDVVLGMEDLTAEKMMTLIPLFLKGQNHG